jgi:polysaccharide biosynthesis protein PelC
MQFFRILLLSLSVVLLAGCATAIQSAVGDAPLERQASWAVLPMANNTDTPQAGLSAEAMIEHQIRALGVVNLRRYPAALSRDSLFEPTERKVTEEALAWAKTQGVRYAVMGSVEEWRYKVGIDGEPAVGVSLQVLDVSTERVVWSASGAQSGWSRQSLAAVAQVTLTKLLSSLEFATTATVTAK